MSLENEPTPVIVAEPPQHVMRALWDLGTLTKTEFVVFASAALLLLVSSKIAQALIGIGINKSLFDYIKHLVNVFITGIDRQADLSSSLIGTVIVWFALGGLVYILLWSAMVIIFDGYNDAIVSYSFVHPLSFHQSSYWGAVVGRALLHIAAGATLILIVIWSTINGVAYAHSTAMQLYHKPPLLAARDFVLLFVGIMAVLQVSVIMLRLMVGRRRILG